MRRRELITLTGAMLVAWPRSLVAQRSKQVLRVGVLMELAETNSQARSNIAALQRGLRRLGWIEEHVLLEFQYRWTSNDPVLVWKFPKELVELRPDVIVTHSTPGVSTLLGQTRSIPVVFVSVSDPVGEGFVTSFARPGGNVTGFTDFQVLDDRGHVDSAADPSGHDDRRLGTERAVRQPIRRGAGRHRGDSGKWVKTPQ